jgi:3-phosphoshikimate 1-carboxyvinyltransferase
MGANVEIAIQAEGAEPVGQVSVSGGRLHGIELGPADVAAAIDEIPILLAVATQAEGVTTIEGAGELRIKESDRLSSMAEGLRRMGAGVEERPDGITVSGPCKLKEATVDSRGDHRVAMALAIAGLVADGPTTIEDADCVEVSYPQFFDHLRQLSHG